MPINALRSGLGVLLLPVLLLSAGTLRAETVAPSPLTGLELVGQARLQVLFWKVFDAELYSPSGTWRGAPPYALSLTYLRNLSGERIAERSVREIREQGFTDELTLARWYELLRNLIPDVGANDEIIGVAQSSGATHFYLNGKLIGGIAEPEFTERFFAIWLGERTSQPDMRVALIGGRP
jgi:hypothetical protein